MVTNQLYVSQQPVLPNGSRYLEVEIDFDRNAVANNQTNQRIFESKFSNVFTNEQLFALRVYRKSFVPSSTTQRDNVDDAILNCCKLQLGLNGNQFLMDFPLPSLDPTVLNGGFFWFDSPTLISVPDFKVVFTPPASFVLPAAPAPSNGESFIFGVITCGSFR